MWLLGSFHQSGMSFVISLSIPSLTSEILRFFLATLKLIWLLQNLLTVCAHESKCQDYLDKISFFSFCPEALKQAMDKIHHAKRSCRFIQVKFQQMPVKDIHFGTNKITQAWLCPEFSGMKKVWLHVRKRRLGGSSRTPGSYSLF